MGDFKKVSLPGRRPLTVLVPWRSEAEDHNKVERLLRSAHEYGIPVGDVIFSCIQDKGSLLDYFYELKDGVDIVLAVFDPATLVQAALVREFPTRLVGPSVESSFLAYNKVYTLQYLDSDTDPSRALDLDSPTLLQDATTALETVGLPAFAKVSCGGNSHGVWKITDMTQLKDIVRSMGEIKVKPFHENKYSPNATFMRDFLRTVLDGDRYPMAVRNAVVVEPYIDAPAKVDVDGCVYNKEIIHWAITDSLRWPGLDISYQGNSMPSTLPDTTQKRIWNRFDEVLSKMIEHGFNNQFANVEFFILADGQIKLIEINARISGGISGLYRACLSGPPLLHALLGLQCGVRPEAPVPTGRAALWLVLRVHDNYTGNSKVRDIIDVSELENVKQDHDVQLSLVMSLDHEFSPGRRAFANLWTYGRTPSDAKNKCREVVGLLMKDPSQLMFSFS